MLLLPCLGPGRVQGCRQATRVLNNALGLARMQVYKSLVATGLLQLGPDGEPLPGGFFDAIVTR